MNLKDQICSLELAKRLSDLGIKQDSAFFWYKSMHIKEYLLHYIDYLHSETDLIIFKERCPNCYAAFTVAELGEMLPGMIKIQDDRLYLTMDCDRCPHYQPMNQVTELYASDCEDNDSEADARAKMLIYLIENGLMKASE